MSDNDQPITGGDPITEDSPGTPDEPSDDQPITGGDPITDGSPGTPDEPEDSDEPDLVIDDPSPSRGGSSSGGGGGGSSRDDATKIVTSDEAGTRDLPETLGTGDTFEEAIADAERTQDRTVDITRDVDRVDIAGEHSERIEQDKENIQEQRENLEDMDSDQFVAVDQQIAEELGEPDAPSQVQNQVGSEEAVVQAAEISQFLSEQEQQASEAQTKIQQQQEQLQQQEQIENQLQEQLERQEQPSRLRDPRTGSLLEGVRPEPAEIPDQFQTETNLAMVGPDHETPQPTTVREQPEGTRIDQANQFENILQPGDTDRTNLPETQTQTGRILGFEQDVEETLEGAPLVTDKMASGIATGAADTRLLFEDTIEGAAQITDPDTLQAVADDPSLVSEGIQRIRSGQVADTPEEAAVMAGTDQQEIARRSGDMFDLALAGSAMSPGLAARAPSTAGLAGRATRTIDTETSGTPVLTRSELEDDITPDQLPEGFTQQQREPSITDEIISEQDAIIRGRPDETPVVGQRQTSDTDTITPGETTPEQGLTQTEIEVLARNRRDETPRQQDFEVERFELADDQSVQQVFIRDPETGSEQIISASGQEGRSLMNQLEDLVDPDAIGIGAGSLVPAQRQIQEPETPTRLDESFGPTPEQTDTGPDIADVGDIPQTGTPTTRTRNPLDEFEARLANEITGLTSPAAITTPRETPDLIPTETTALDQQTTPKIDQTITETTIIDETLQPITDTTTTTTPTTTATGTTTGTGTEPLTDPTQPIPSRPIAPTTTTPPRIVPWILPDTDIDEEDEDIFEEQTIIQEDFQETPDLITLLGSEPAEIQEDTGQTFTGFEPRNTENEIQDLDQDIDQEIDKLL